MRRTSDTLSRRIAGAVLPRLGAAYIRLVHRTVRWTWEGRDVVDGVLASREPFIVAFWHGRLLMMAPPMRESVHPIHVLISNNRDGELIARLIGFFGGRTIRGSARDRRKDKGKGGDAALRAALDRLSAGELVAITPDGPRGPRMRAQPGIAVISARTGLPVIPFAWATRRARILGSWDRFMLPWPFDRGVYSTGTPIFPGGGTRDAIEAHRQAIEDGLNAATRLADDRAGRVPVEPA